MHRCTTISRLGQSGLGQSGSSHPDHSPRRQRSISRRVRGRYGGRADGRCLLRQRRHSGCVADAAGIADRTVKAVHIARPRSNAADTGILGRRSCGSSHKTQQRKAQECHSAGHPAMRNDRIWCCAFHGAAVLFRHVLSGGATCKGAPKFHGVLGRGALRRVTPRTRRTAVKGSWSGDLAVEAKSASSPGAKNIPLRVWPKSVIYPQPSRSPGGAARDRHGRGTGCGGR